MQAVGGEAGLSRWPRLARPAVAATIAGVSVFCAVASVVVYAYNESRLGTRVHYLYADDLVVGILYPLTGAFLVRRRPGNAVGWLLVGTSVLGVNALANQYAVAGLVTAPGAWPGARAAAWLATWGWTPELVVPVFLPLLFPDGSLPSTRWRPFARAAACCFGLLVLAAMLAPMGIDSDHSVSNPLGTTGLFTGVVLVMVLLIAFVGIPGAVLALVLRQRRATGVERAQLEWLSLAAVVTLVLGVAAGAMRQPVQEVLFALAFSAIPAGIVIAVVRYRLFDVEVVLNRTVVYGLLSSVVLAGYFAAVVGVGEAAQRTGLVAVVVLALLAASARNRVQRGVDRLLFGYRKDPYAVVSRVGRRLDDASAPLDALRELTVELCAVLRLPSAEVIPDDPRLPPGGIRPERGGHGGRPGRGAGPARGHAPRRPAASWRALPARRAVRARGRGPVRRRPGSGRGPDRRAATEPGDPGRGPGGGAPQAAPRPARRGGAGTGGAPRRGQYSPAADSTRRPKADATVSADRPIWR